MIAPVRNAPLTWPGAVAVGLLGMGSASGCRDRPPEAVGLDLVPVVLYTSCAGLADRSTFSASIGVTITAGGQILQRSALTGRLCEAPFGRGPLSQDGQPSLPAGAFCLPPGGPPVTIEICATGYESQAETRAVDSLATAEVPLCGGAITTTRYAPIQITYGIAPASGDGGTPSGCAALEAPPVDLAACDCGSKG